MTFGSDTVDTVIADALTETDGDRDKAAILVLEWAQGQVNLQSETLGQYSYTRATKFLTNTLDTLRLKGAAASLSGQTPQVVLRPNPLL